MHGLWLDGEVGRERRTFSLGLEPSQGCLWQLLLFASCQLPLDSLPLSQVGVETGCQLMGSSKDRGGSGNSPVAGPPSWRACLSTSSAMGLEECLPKPVPGLFFYQKKSLPVEMNICMEPESACSKEGNRKRKFIKDSADPSGHLLLFRKQWLTQILALLYI